MVWFAPLLVSTAVSTGSVPAGKAVRKVIRRPNFLPYFRERALNESIDKTAAAAITLITLYTTDLALIEFAWRKKILAPYVCGHMIGVATGYLEGCIQK